MKSRFNLLTLIFIAGLILRLFVAFARTDMVWPDEHFQTLEPASTVVFGYGTLSWEWQMGYRSWILPSLYIPLFQILKAFGIDGGVAVIQWSRAFTALFAASTILLLNRSLVLSNVSRSTRIVCGAMYAFSPAMILWSCATLADVWAMIGVCIAQSEILKRTSHWNARVDARDGALIGGIALLPALLKPQMIFWTLGMTLVLALTRASRKFWARFAFGASIVLGTLGLIDWGTWGAPFKSLEQHWNIGRKIAQLHGESPWWDYLPKVFFNLGPLLFLALFVALAACFSKRLRPAAIQHFRAKSRILLIGLIPSLVFSASLMQIGHKETRFILPAVPALFFALGVLLDVAFRDFFRFKDAPRNAGFIAVILLLAAWGGYRSFRIELPLSGYNVAELETRIYEETRSLGRPNACLLLIDHPWTHTRGQLILGGARQIISQKFQELDSREVAACDYAILKGRDELRFLALAGEKWELVQRTKNGRLLYKNRSGRNRITST